TLSHSGAGGHSVRRHFAPARLLSTPQENSPAYSSSSSSSVVSPIFMLSLIASDLIRWDSSHFSLSLLRSRCFFSLFTIFSLLLFFTLPLVSSLRSPALTPLSFSSRL